MTTESTKNIGKLDYGLIDINMMSSLNLYALHQFHHHICPHVQMSTFLTSRKSSFHL